MAVRMTKISEKNNDCQNSGRDVKITGKDRLEWQRLYLFWGAFSEFLSCDHAETPATSPGKPCARLRGSRLPRWLE